MRKIGAYAVIGALAAVVCSPSPVMAFGFRVGPFHLGLPLLDHAYRPAHRHRASIHSASDPHDRVALVDKTDVGAAQPALGANPALLYPNLALTGIFDDIFWPTRSSPWPFGYDAIFGTAFEKARQDQDAQACQQVERADAIAARIRAEVRPSAGQSRLLQQLGQALGMASGYLSKSCPPEIPAQPVARLQLMQAQIQTLTMALDIVRPPLQQFAQSLSPGQRARFAAAQSAPAACATMATATDWPIQQIDKTVQTNDDQSQALSDLRQAFAAAADDLNAHCPKTPPATPLGRLEATEARLDAGWRAALAMQAALGKFESRLSDEQRSRFEAIDLAAAH